VNKQSSTLEPQFFALQQSPQQPKQLLIASGVTDRYFQIAKCFRDEDGRKDRQAEFTQIDLEMGFLTGELEKGSIQNDWRIGGQEIKKVIEGIIRTIWRAAGRQEEADVLDSTEFRVIRYDEAMKRYGSDKPDLRYGMELVEMGEVLRASEGTEQEAEEGNSTWKAKQEIEVLAFTPPRGTISNSEMDAIFRSNKEVLDGVERFKVEAGNTNVMAKLLMRKSANVRSFLDKEGIQGQNVNVSSLVSCLEEAQRIGYMTEEDVKVDHTYLFTARKTLPASSGSTKLGDLRRLLAESMAQRGHVKLVGNEFTWITEFPLFTMEDSDKVELSRGRWSSCHHPFTSPMQKDIALVKEVLSGQSMLSVDEKTRIMNTCKGQHYDLVLNGVEIGGGSIRIHDAQLQRSILENALELTPAEVSRFGHLLRALASGAPPHGGIALGFDRLLSILCNTSTIRDVIAFPKSATSKDLLFECPDALDSTALLEQYGLRPAAAAAAAGGDKKV
jgi:aspartyl-tRNA synthetase